MVLVAASAFGPYVGAGLRTDQVVVYGLALVFGALCIWSARFTVAQLAVLGLLGLFAALAVTAMIFDPALRGTSKRASQARTFMPA